MDEKREQADYEKVLGEFYRGELQRTYKWRERLDKTTNWAILTIVGILTWTFSSKERPHYVLLIGIIAVLLLSLIESRRYKMYVVWNSRVRVLEENFFAPLLSKDGRPKDDDWREALARDLKSPVHKIGLFEAFARRLRRVYLWLYLILVITWFIRLLMYPTATISWTHLANRACIGRLPGLIILVLITIFMIFILLASLYRRKGKYTIRERRAKGEIRPKKEKERNWKDL